jgi:hypothetical protein
MSAWWFLVGCYYSGMDALAARLRRLPFVWAWGLYARWTEHRIRMMQEDMAELRRLLRDEGTP